MTSQKIYKGINHNAIRKGVDKIMNTKNMELEAFIHVHLWKSLNDTIEKNPNSSFSEVIFKYRLESNKEADLVIFDNKHKAWLVIEAKREGNDRKNLDPYSYKVIEQASEYANELGTPYFATCNQKILVLFQTHKDFVPLIEREVKHYDLPSINKLDEFAQSLLLDLLNIKTKPKLVKWTPRHDILIARFRTLHNIISPLIITSLCELLERDKNFEKEYVEWLDKQGFEYSDERNIITAHEIAYLLMNKIIFYKMIEKQHNLPKLEKVEIGDLRIGLDKYFKRVIDEIDFEAIFEREELFDKIPFSDDVKQIINEFIEELNYYDLEDMRTDIGQVYRYLITKEEKKKFGQYYTDNEIANLIVRLCVKNSYDKVLDPACGSGTFLLNVYDRLMDLKKDENPNEDKKTLHKEILNQIYATEINQFPAHLSVIQIALKNLRATTNRIAVLVRDFFKTPLYALYEMETHKLGGKMLSEKIKGIPIVDAIVGNPPYIRQESIKNKKEIRDIALDKYYKKIINEKSDIYSYFFAYSLNFLKENGRLGLITSNSWLDVSYGEGLKKLFLDKTKINTIIAFDKGVFKDAIINTCVTILEKSSNTDNDNNIVRFLRLKKFLETEKVMKYLIKVEDFEDENVRLKIIKQGDLKKETKWSRFHRAPIIYYNLINNIKLTKLSKLAKVYYPYKTSANEFFILNKENAELWNIEKKYLKPVVVTPRELEKPVIEDENVNKYFLLVDKPKSILREEKAKVLNYIEYGEKKKILLKRGSVAGMEVTGYQNIPSFKNKKYWYLFEKKPIAPILFPSMFRNRHDIFYNKCGAYATHNFYQIMPFNKSNTKILLAFLNSSLGTLFIELGGRYLGNGLLSLMVYEVENLPVINPDNLNEKEKEKIENVFTKFIEKKKEIKELDNVLFGIFKFSKIEKFKIYEAIDDLMKIRREGLMKVENGLNGVLKRKQGISNGNVELVSLKRWINV